MIHSPILDASDLICQRRRLAMACGCRDTVTDPTTGLSGAVEAMDVRDGVLWARVRTENLVVWVPAGRLVVERQRPAGSRCATPPPPRPDSEPPPRIERLRALTPVDMTVVVGMNPTLTEAEVPVVVGDEKETVRP